MNVKLIGNFIQHLEVELLSDEDFYAQKGALIYLEKGIEKEAQMNGGGTGALGALGNLIGSKLSGESIFLMHYSTGHNLLRKLFLAVHSGFTPLKSRTKP